MDKAIQGIRRSESVKRAKTYNEPTMCRFYGSKKNHVEVVLPILDFTDKDVEEFIKERCIKLHPLYYNEDGSRREEVIYYSNGEEVNSHLAYLRKAFPGI